VISKRHGGSVNADRLADRVSSMASLRESFAFMRGNVLVLTLSGALGMFTRSMVFPYTPLYILELGGDPGRVGIVYALGPLGGLLLFPIAGYLADHVRRARLIAFTGYLTGVFIFLNALAPTWEWVAVARVLQGVSVMQFPASSAILADSLLPENRGRGLATMMTVSGTVAIFAPYVAGRMLEIYGVEFGMRILFTAMAISYAAGSTINLIFLRETREITSKRLGISGLASAFRDAYVGIPAMLRQFPRVLKAMSLIIILLFVTNGLASPFWVVYARDHIGLSAADWGFVLFVAAAFRLVVGIPAGFMVDRYGRTRFILAGVLASAAVIPLFLVVDSVVGAVLVRCALALITAFFGPACAALVADIIPRDIRGRAMSTIGRGSVMIGAAAGGTGGPGVGLLVIGPLMASSLAGGYLYEWNPVSLWLIVPVITLFAFLLAAIFVRDPRKAEV
jgi:MFS family permease